MKSKTLLDLYLSRTTMKERNHNPREEGIISTLSDILERPETFENLPKALPKMHEFHQLLIDRSKCKDDEEKEAIASMLTACFSVMVFDKYCSNQRLNRAKAEEIKEKNNEADIL